MLPASEGDCLANLIRWHYDRGSSRCKKFTYGGCRGNENNFKTFHECQSACARQNKPTVADWDLARLYDWLTLKKCANTHQTPPKWSKHNLNTTGHSLIGNNSNGQQPNQSPPNRSPSSHYPNPKQTNYDLPVIDCKLSNWSPWSTCSALCGNGRRTRSRYIIQMPQNGGKPCDKKLTRTQKCKDLPPCPQDYMSNQDSNINNSGSGGGGGGGSGKNAKSNQNQMSPGSSYPMGSGFHRTTTTTTTSSSSMMDDEDDSKFSRSLRVAESLFLIPNPTQSISFVSDGAAATSTEMELLGSSSFHIRNGQVYPFGNLETSWPWTNQAKKLFS